MDRPNNPGSGFEFVPIGERVKNGDEVWSPSGYWSAIGCLNEKGGGPVSEDKGGLDWPFGWYRRKLKFYEGDSKDPRPLTCGEGYRFLKVGETVGKGDEVYHYKQWVPFHGGYTVHQMPPCPVGWYRRRVSPPIEKLNPVIVAVAFVDGNELFRGIERLKTAWFHSGVCFTYGDADKTMVKARVVGNDIRTSRIDQDFYEEAKELYRRIQVIGDDMLVSF